MKIDVGTKQAWLIGDPHLGKKFEVGVPLHRRGEREQRQLALFCEELATPDVDFVVMVGDLFDHPYVGYPVCLDAADAVLHAARERPDVQFYMMAGNHDLPKNVATVGAFDIFSGMVRGRVPNLWVIKQACILDGMAFFPWEWGYAAEDQVPTTSGWRDVHVAIGHWDLVDYGPSKLDGKVHLAPVAKLRTAFGDAVRLYSGHYHEARDYPVGDTIVHGTGSMEPYSHGEDAGGAIYVTISREEALRADPALFRDKCVRVVLGPGEELPQLDALAITAHRTRSGQADDGGGASLSLADFDWGDILAKKLAPLDPLVRDFIKERLSTDADETTAEE